MSTERGWLCAKAASPHRNVVYINGFFIILVMWKNIYELFFGTKKNCPFQASVGLGHNWRIFLLESHFSILSKRLTLFDCEKAVINCIYQLRRFNFIVITIAYPDRHTRTNTRWPGYTFHSGGKFPLFFTLFSFLNRELDTMANLAWTIPGTRLSAICVMEPTSIAL